LYNSIIIISILLVLSALISASEASIVSVNKIRIKHLAQEGNRKAKIIAKIHSKYEDFFASILFIGNLLNITVATVGTSLAINIIGENSAVAIASASIITTILIVVIGELTPKSLSTIRPEKWALLSSDIVIILMKITMPLVFIFALIPKGINRLVRKPDGENSPLVTTNELRMLIDVGEEEGTLESSQGEMLENVFRFAETEAKEIMTPRNDIQWIHFETSLKEFLDKYKNYPHSRFPIYDDDYDDVVGILSTKDVMTLTSEKPDQSAIVNSIMREPLFVPEAKRLDDLFTLMRKTGNKITLVVDEFGGISGLITLTMLIEQIVGPTGEEGIRLKEKFITLDANTFEVEGTMLIDDANDQLDLSIPEGDYETIAGFVLENYQKIPEEGDKASYGNLRFTISEIEGPRISKVRIRKRLESREDHGTER
jgi:putative hemolysin